MDADPIIDLQSRPGRVLRHDEHQASCALSRLDLSSTSSPFLASQWEAHPRNRSVQDLLFAVDDAKQLGREAGLLPEPQIQLPQPAPTCGEGYSKGSSEPCFSQS